jgi:hypothetical protein
MLSDEENQEVDDEFHINTTISLLWLCTAFLSIPTLVVWSTSPKYFKIFYFVYLKYHSHHFLWCSLTLPNDYWLIPSSVWSVCGMMILQKSKAVHERFAFFKYIYIRWKKVRLFINIQNQIKNFYFILNQNVVLVAVMLHMATLAVCSRFFLFCWYPTV